MLLASNVIASNQYRLTLNTKLATDMLLDCNQIYPNANISYQARKILLNVEFDAAHLVMQ